MYIRAPGPHSNANRESDLFRNPNQFGFGGRRRRCFGGRGKVVAQLLRQGQRLLHLMIVGSDTERAGAENGFLTWGKMWQSLIEVGLARYIANIGKYILGCLEYA